MSPEGRSLPSKAVEKTGRLDETDSVGSPLITGEMQAQLSQVGKGGIVREADRVHEPPNCARYESADNHQGQGLGEHSSASSPERYIGQMYDEQ